MPDKYFNMHKNVPYKNLYIYYIEGRLKPDGAVSDKDFIGNWEEDEFTFLFFSEPAHEKVETILSAQPGLRLIDKFFMSYDEWQGGALVPFKIGRFLITPPWFKPDASIGKFDILLDPGVVFGNGAHTTTHACVRALELICSKNKIETVLDLGTGTGLLALAAAKLGCKKIIAVDFNFLAAKTAENNIRLNRRKDSILAVQGRAENFIDRKADLLIANIHYDVMKDLIISNGFLEKKYFVLSGLLRTQARNVEHVLTQLPVKIIKKWEQDGIWHTFAGKRH